MTSRRMRLAGDAARMMINKCVKISAATLETYAYMGG
jgi:hypothetical protein